MILKIFLGAEQGLKSPWDTGGQVFLRRRVHTTVLGWAAIQDLRCTLVRELTTAEVAIGDVTNWLWAEEW